VTQEVVRVRIEREGHAADIVADGGKPVEQARLRAALRSVVTHLDGEEQAIGWRGAGHVGRPR
jgi:hypothetical protein